MSLPQAPPRTSRLSALHSAPSSSFSLQARPSERRHVTPTPASRASPYAVSAGASPSLYSARQPYGAAPVRSSSAVRGTSSASNPSLRTPSGRMDGNNVHSQPQSHGHSRQPSLTDTVDKLYEMMHSRNRQIQSIYSDNHRMFSDEFQSAPQSQPPQHSHQPVIGQQRPPSVSPSSTRTPPVLRPPSALRQPGSSTSSTSPHTSPPAAVAPLPLSRISNSSTSIYAVSHVSVPSSPSPLPPSTTSSTVSSSSSMSTTSSPSSSSSSLVNGNGGHSSSSSPFGPDRTMPMIGKHSSSSMVSQSSPAVPFPLVGFRNLGNTCFMNSAMQCLMSCRSLVDFFQSKRYECDLNPNRGMKGALAREFGDLVSEIQRSSNHSAVSPATWKSVFTRWAPRFSGYSQQDAQEFLRAAIDGLHEDLNRVRQQPAYEELKDIDGELVVAQSERWWSHFCARNDSFIFDLFGGQLRSTLSCSKCKSVSIAFDPFMDLSLPIPKPKSSLFRSAKNVTSLEDCLDEFFASETLDHQEKVFCKKCGKHTVMQKRLSLFRFPKVLVLHVKRFATHAVSVSKITTEVTFPTDGLSVSRFLDKETNPSLSRCNSEPKYKLFGVVHHFGTAHGGHYTASGLRKGQWYEFDDSRVSDSSEAALKGDSAYVLFYERVS